MTSEMPDETEDPRDERLRVVEEELRVVRGQRDAAWGQIEAMRRSVWWRSTWPLRRLAARLPRGR